MQRMVAKVLKGTAQEMVLYDEGKAVKMDESVVKEKRRMVRWAQVELHMKDGQGKRVEQTER